MAATNPSHNRPDLWYFPSDYAMRPAIPLHYSTGNAKPSPVPLTDLFPVFASSPSVNVSTAVPIVQLCVVGNSASGVGVPFPPAAAATSLSLCLFDKCQDALAKVSSDGGAATYEALVSVVGGGERGAAGETVTKHFNSYNTLEECAIRQCPTEYFVSRSSICISLRHPYFVKRNIVIPAMPPRHSPAENFPFDDEQNFANYLTHVRSTQRTSSVPEGPDLGVHLPALPVDFPCDSASADQATGAIVRTGVDPRAAEFGMRMTSAGTWITAGDKNDQWALSHNGSMSGSGVVHSWMAKSTVFRGPNGMGELMAENLRGLVATLPVNLYSLGHCPKSTGRFTASKLSGEACKASIECVFSLCVNGKCAEAASGKQLDAATALQSMRRSIVEYEDKNKRENAEWWMAWIGTRIGWVVGGLVVLRVLVLANRRRYVARQQAKVRRAEATRRGADEPPEFVVGGPATSASDVQ